MTENNFLDLKDTQHKEGHHKPNQIRAYLEASRIFTMGHFCENSLWLLTINYFAKMLHGRLFININSIKISNKDYAC